MQYGPYGIPHAYKCKAKKFLNFSFLATAIVMQYHEEKIEVVLS